MRASAQRCHCHRTLATHGAGNAAACIAARQTRQVIEQAAAGKGLRSKAQHRRRRRHLTLTVHNQTTERDLQPPSQGEPRHQTSHRHLATANAQRLQHLNREPDTTVTLRVDRRPAVAPRTGRGGGRPPPRGFEPRASPDPLHGPERARGGFPSQYLVLGRNIYIGHFSEPFRAIAESPSFRLLRGTASEISPISSLPFDRGREGSTLLRG